MNRNLANASFKKPAASFRERLDDPVLGQMLEHWRRLSAAAGGGAPPRAAFDPMAVPKLLRHLQLHQREATGRFRCRLSGTTVVQQLGRDATGSYLDEAIRPEAVAGRMRLFNRALEAGRPLAYRGVIEIPGRGYKAYKRLLLPLRDERGEARFVLSAMAFKVVGPMDAGRLDDIHEIIEMRDETAPREVAAA